MIRSRRCAAVIAAGGLGAGWGVLAAAVATADTGRDGRADQGGISAVERIVHRDSVAADWVRGAGADRVALAGRRSAEADEWPWPCPFWPAPVNWPTYNRSVHAEIVAAVPEFDLRPVAGVGAPTPDPASDRMLGGLASASKPAAARDGSAVESPAVPLSVSVAVPPSQGGPWPPVPPPPPPPKPTVPTPITPPASAPQPATPQRTETVVTQPSLGRLATLALPGLAGLASLTGAGSYLGYRQAKAGFALRAAGTARFLP